MAGSQQELFDAFVAPLIGLPVAHAWQGQGAAIFLEFGALTSRSRLDGTPGQPEGEMGLMIEWSWRVEGRRSILWGSWTDQGRWARGLACLAKGSVAGASIFARLPELDLALSTGLHVVSLMTATGDPCWTLFDRRNERGRWLRIRRGRLCVEEAP